MTFLRPTKPHQPTSAPQEYNPTWRFLAEMNGNRYQLGADSAVAAGILKHEVSHYGYTTFGVMRFDTLPVAVQQLWNMSPIVSF